MDDLLTKYQVFGKQEKEKFFLMFLVKYGQCLHITCEESCQIHTYCKEILPQQLLIYQQLHKEYPLDIVQHLRKKAATKVFIRIYGEEDLFDELL